MSIMACSASPRIASRSTATISRPPSRSTRTPSQPSLRYGVSSGPSGKSSWRKAAREDMRTAPEEGAIGSAASIRPPGAPLLRGFGPERHLQLDRIERHLGPERAARATPQLDEPITFHGSERPGQVRYRAARKRGERLKRRRALVLDPGQKLAVPGREHLPEALGRGEPHLRVMRARRDLAARDRQRALLGVPEIGDPDAKGPALPTRLSRHGFTPRSASTWSTAFQKSAKSEAASA